MLQDGYAIVQEFVDGGEQGDARIFLLDGQILQRDGHLAAFRRVPSDNDPRANISAGARSVPLEIGDVQLGIVDAMSAKLVADGMWFVGIDVIGDKVVEINAESPGGMQSVETALRDRRLPHRHRSTRAPRSREILSRAMVHWLPPASVTSRHSPAASWRGWPSSEVSGGPSVPVSSSSIADMMAVMACRSRAEGKPQPGS